jgi:hypothetical protein
VAGRRQHPHKSLSELLSEATEGLVSLSPVYTESQLETILSPRHFVDVRQTYGGPAPEETARAIDASSIEHDVDQAWLTEKMTALIEAERRLADRAQAL